MKFYFILVLAVMLIVTTWASLGSPVSDGIIYIVANRWGVATFCDTYFAFVTVYLWMAYKEPAPYKRIAWFVAVMLLGTIAIAVFFLHELYLNRGQSLENFLLRRPAAKVQT